MSWKKRQIILSKIPCLQSRIILAINAGNNDDGCNRGKHNDVFVYDDFIFYSRLQSGTDTSGLSLLQLLKKKRKEDTCFSIEEDLYHPFVSVQLPIFNEMYVVERIIDTVAHFDYPGRLFHKLQRNRRYMA